MLLLTATSDVIDVVTSAAATVDVVAAFVDMSTADPPVVKGSTSGKQVTAISTATTTTVVSSPAASTTRNVKTLHIRNKSASTATDVTVRITVSGPASYELFKCNLAPGEALEYVEGIGFFEVAASPAVATNINRSTAAQSGFAADTYITGSSVPLGIPVVGTTYRCQFDVTKTAAGTATPIVIVRIGTAGTTADTARLTFTFGAGTVAADTAVVEIRATFRSVGAGTSAILQGQARADTNLTTTGWSNAVKALQVTSAGFDSTVANSIIGLSYNGGASASHTIQLVNTDIVNY